MSQFSQILGSSNIWDNVNPQLNAITESLKRQLSYWWNSRSRTLNNVLSSTITNWYRGANPYQTLCTLCSIMLDKTPIQFRPRYMSISSEDADTLDIEDVYSEIGDISTNRLINIVICHVSKGKSYLRKVLDATETLNRLKPIEMLCLENPNHFVRIYKGFGQTNINDITIFTDQPTTGIVETIIAMLPNLLEINKLAPVEGVAFSKEGELHNTRVDALRKIFAYLYEYYKIKTDYSLTETDREDIKTTLNNFINEFMNLFDFTTSQLTTFTENLAKARNENAMQYYNNKLAGIKNNITSYEEALAQYYIDKSNTERAIIAQKTLGSEDVATFMETIKNTKAIEILSANSNTLKLRVTAPLQYFTESDFEAYENNIQSEYNQNFGSDQVLKSIFHKIFVTREYKLLMQGIITLKIGESYNNKALTYYAQRYDLSNFTEFPNPHLYHHNCWSRAQTEMDKNICEGNFELVVMQMVATVQSINVAERASFVSGLLSDMRSSEMTDRYFHVLDLEGKKYNYNELKKHEKELMDNKIKEEAKETIENAPEGEYTQVELPDDGEDWNVTPTTNTETREHIYDIVTAELIQETRNAETNEEITVNNDNEEVLPF